MIAYIPTRATPRLRSHLLARKLGFKPVLVCDDSAQADVLRRDFGVRSKEIIVADGAPGPPSGAVYKRDLIAREVAARGEWLVWLDDNVSHLTCLRRDLTADRIDLGDKSVDWRHEFAHEATIKEAWDYIEETIDKAESLGTINCGFATEENFFYRARKWQYFGYCRSQFTLYKNDGSGWSPCPNLLIEDFYKSVDVVVRYGCVVVNRHLKPIKPVLFEAGGIGTLQDRLPYLQENCRWLMEHYPGLLSLSKGRDYHVTFAKRTFNTVSRWRRANRVL